jgi:integrase
MIVALSNGDVLRDKADATMTLSAYRDAHEASFGHGKQPATLAEWRHAISHAIDALGDVRLDELDWSDAGEIRKHMTRNGASPATVRKTMVLLRAMLQRAVVRKLLRENPLANEELGPLPARPKRIFAAEEVAAMADVAPSLSWEALIQLAYTSGLRRAELWHLRWQDFDADSGTVRVEEHHAGRHVTPQGQDVPILPWVPKTKRSTRTVPIPPATVALLLRLRMQSDGSPYLFVSNKRLTAIDAKAKAGKLHPRYELLNNFNRQFDAIQDDARAKIEADTGQPYDWSHGCFHDLRKSFATRAAAAGVRLHELQAHLGHSSITVTAEYYTGVEDTAADRLRAVFASVA